MDHYERILDLAQEQSKRASLFVPNKDEHQESILWNPQCSSITPTSINWRSSDSRRFSRM